MINEFKNKYLFLSNFFSSVIEHDGYKYRTVEHLYQSMKTEDCREYTKIRLANSPAQAKKLGREATLVDRWENIKDGIMFMAVYKKFKQNSQLRTALLRTCNEQLIEGNYWHDNYWGDCKCNRCKKIKGKNKLGIILMEVRDYYAKENNG